MMTVFISGCASTQMQVLDGTQAPEDWVVEIKQTIANPLHYRFTLIINGQEVLEALSSSKEVITGKYRGREISMSVEFKSGFAHSDCIVIISLNDVPTYKQSFKTLSI
ncbi:MAG: hypothetical protein AB3N10_10200 [Allomuricauda sp.]